MSCKHILIKSNESGTPVQFTAILYAIISKFNIDGLFRLIFTRWQVFLSFNFTK